MNVQEICAAVRWCYDEEELNETNFAQAQPNDNANNDNSLMNNIIKAKIGDALRWVCLYAPAELLTGSDGSSDASIIVENTFPTPASITDSNAGVVDGAPDSVTYNRFALPANFLRLVRVRATGWHRAVSGDSLIREDSDEYLQLHDPTCAYATADRPQAAIINTKRKHIEVWPAPTSGGSVEFTCIVTPISVNVTPETETVSVPELVKPAFIYYLAFLVLSAYEDSRAARMLEIAKMNVSRTENTQNK
jgi:hypothetical protein